MTPEQIRSVLTGAQGDPKKAKELALQLTPDTTALSAVLADLAADSFIAGLLTSYLQLMELAQGTLTKGALAKAERGPAKWSNWAPGDYTAANVTAAGGLADVLDAQNVAIQNMTDTQLHALGDVLAVSTGSGEPVDVLARNLEQYGYTAPDRAGIIAATETSRAVHVATFQAYDSNGVEEWNVVLSDGACSECVDAQNSGPYKIDDTADAPPIHPWCRCTSAPIFDASKLKAAAGDLAIGALAVDSAEGLTEGEGEGEGADEVDKLLNRLAGDLDGYLHGEVLGDYTTDLQGRRLAIAVGRQAPDVADAADLSAATDEELAQAVAESPTSNPLADEIGEDATEALLEEIDSRDEDDATADAERKALAWDGTGAPPANPYTGNDHDLAAIWQQAFDDARNDPEQAKADLRDYDQNNLEG